MKKSTPLSRILHRLLFFWMVLPCVLVLSLICISMALQQEREMELANAAIAASLDRYVQAYVDDASHALDYLAAIGPTVDDADFHKSLKAMVRFFGQFELLSRLGPDQHVLDSTHPKLIGRKMYLPFDISSGAGPGLAPLPTLSPETENLVLYAFSPSTDGTTIVGELSLRGLQSFLSSYSGYARRGELTIILTDHFGNVISHPEMRLVNEQANLGHLSILRQAQLTGQTTTSFFKMDTDSYLGSVVTMPGTNWKLVVAKPVQAIAQPILEMLGMFLALVLLGYGVLVAILRREIRKRLVAPLSALTEAVDRAVSGEDDLKNLPEQPVWELRSLSRRFKEIVRQVADREKELISARQEYASIVDNLPDAFYRADMDGNILMANQSTMHMLRFDSYEEFIGINIAHDLYKYPEERRKLLYSLELHGRVWGYRCTLVARDGTLVEVEANVRLIYNDKTGEPVAVEGIARDVTERIKTAQALERFRFALDNAGDSIYLYDPQQRSFVDMNETACAAIGYTREELLRMQPGDLIPEAQLEHDIQKFREALEMDGPQIYETVHKRKDGSTFPVEVTLRAMPHEKGDLIIGIIRNIANRQKTQELLIQTEKMMSVGGLAAGMAHEINNPLGIILQGAQLIRRRLSPKVPKNELVAQEIGADLEQLNEYLSRRSIFDYLDGIQDAGARAARIVSNMLEFSRKSESRTEQNDLNELLEQSLDLAAKDYGLRKLFDLRAFSIQREYQPDLPLVPCNGTEIQQVFINLLKNSAQAMIDRPKDDDRTPTIILRTASGADEVMVEIEDNGPGMTDEVRKRVFEPFFTTKPPGVGTGLGLSVSYFIITQNHSGRFDLESTPGKGTLFSIRLPLHKQL